MARYKYTDIEGNFGESDTPYWAIAMVCGRQTAEDANVKWHFSNPNQPYSQRGDSADVFHPNGQLIGKLENIG